MEVKKMQVAFKDHRGEIFDILENVEIDSVSLIKSKKAKRGNHYHKETAQYIYMISGKMRILSQIPGEEIVETTVEKGDLYYTPPGEIHAWSVLEDSQILVLTKGPRGGKSYESDTYRLSDSLEQRRQATRGTGTAN